MRAGVRIARLLLAGMLTTGFGPGTAAADGMTEGERGGAQDHHHHGHVPAGQPPMPAPAPGEHDHQDHAGHEHPLPPGGSPYIPPITDADRAAAFPDVRGHTVHDQAIHYFVLFDQLELQTGAGGGRWENSGWIGGDLDRLWFRTEGKAHDGRFAEARAHVLYGRAIARWWDVVAGVRQDVRPGPARTWLAFGIQGLAPYWFEVQATAYVGAGGRTALHLETEYELLLTNRLIAQPLVGVEIFGRSDPERGIGAGLSTAEAGMRLRYELRREVAPYVGLVWSRKYFGTADFARTAGERAQGTRLAAGLRVWF
jgi:copper resistance protein B